MGAQREAVDHSPLAPCSPCRPSSAGARVHRPQTCDPAEVRRRTLDPTTATARIMALPAACPIAGSPAGHRLLTQAAWKAAGLEQSSVRIDWRASRACEAVPPAAGGVPCRAQAPPREGVGFRPGLGGLGRGGRQIRIPPPVPGAASCDNPTYWHVNETRLLNICVPAHSHNPCAGDCMWARRGGRT